MLIAVVVYDGVLDDECQAFRSVLGLVDDARVIMVGARAGSYGGVGGAQVVDATFDEVDLAEVVIVPGGLGCERAADDPELRAFLRRMERSSRFVAASSTGTVVLASAGLLRGQPAATHWLASDLLRRYGSVADSRRLVVAGNIITCEGRISAVDAAFTLVERLDGTAAVERIKAELLERGQPLLHQPGRWSWRRNNRRTARMTIRPRRKSRRQPLGTAERTVALQPHVEAPPTTVTPLSVMVELVDNDELRRRLKRRSHRRHRF